MEIHYAVLEAPEGWPRLTAGVVRLVGGRSNQVGYLRTAPEATPLCRLTFNVARWRECGHVARRSRSWTGLGTGLRHTLEL
jgi:hypothetical protein